MVEEVSITLKGGTVVTTVGEHIWEDSGLPGLSKCQCGIYRGYNFDKREYEYSVEENNGR